MSCSGIPALQHSSIPGFEAPCIINHLPSFCTSFRTQLYIFGETPVRTARTLSAECAADEWIDECIDDVYMDRSLREMDRMRAIDHMHRRTQHTSMAPHTNSNLSTRLLAATTCIALHVLRTDRSLMCGLRCVHACVVCRCLVCSRERCAILPFLWKAGGGLTNNSLAWQS